MKNPTSHSIEREVSELMELYIDLPNYVSPKLRFSQALRSSMERVAQEAREKEQEKFATVLLKIYETNGDERKRVTFEYWCNLQQALGNLSPQTDDKTPSV